MSTRPTVKTRALALAAISCVAGFSSLSCLSAGQRLSQAQTRADNNDEKEAYEILKPIMPQLKDDAQAHALMARLLRYRGEKATAYDEIALAIAMAPGNGEYKKQAANFYYSDGDFAKTLQLWSPYFDGIRTKTASDHAKMSVVFFAAKRFREAAEAALAGLEIDPGSNDCLFDAAMGLRAAGEPEKAKATLDKLLKASPDDDQALFLRSLCHSDSYDFEEAEDDSKLLAGRVKNHYYAPVSGAYREYMDDRGYDAARSLLREWFARDGMIEILGRRDNYGLDPAFRSFCLIEFARWRFDTGASPATAQELLKEAISFDPDSPEAALAEAERQYRDKAYAKAAALSLDAFSRKPGLSYAASAQELAWCLYETGEAVAAFNWLHYANSLDPDNVNRALIQRLLTDPRNEAANDAYAKIPEPLAKTRYDDLRKAAEGCIAASPGFALGHFWRAFALYQTKEYDDALAGFSKTVELLPGYAEAYAMRASIILPKGNFAEAEGDITKYLSVRNSATEARLQRAILRSERLADQAGALADCAELLRMGATQDQRQSARVTAARAARILGRLDLARTYAEALIADSKSAPSGRAETGKILCAAGDFAGAMAEFDKVPGSMTSDGELPAFMAWAYAELNEPGKSGDYIIIADYLGGMNAIPEYWRAKALIAAVGKDRIEIRKCVAALYKLEAEKSRAWFKARATRFAAWKDDPIFKGQAW